MPESERQLLEAALSAHQAGDLGTAAARYRALLDRAPDHYDALRLLGIVDLHGGHTDIQRHAVHVFDADFAEIRVPSGAMGNLFGFMATAKPGDTIIAPPASVGEGPPTGPKHLSSTLLLFVSYVYSHTLPMASMVRTSRL